MRVSGVGRVCRCVAVSASPHASHDLSLILHPPSVSPPTEPDLLPAARRPPKPGAATALRTAGMRVSGKRLGKGLCTCVLMR